MSFRNEELLRNASDTMNHTLDALRAINLQSQKESVTLSRVALQTQKDSMTLKALTTVTTVYLPASLIAVSLFDLSSCDLFFFRLINQRAFSTPTLSK
jgi:hypothetical protein